MSDIVTRSEPEYTGLTPEYFQKSFANREQELQAALHKLYVQDENTRENFIPDVRDHYERCKLVATFAAIPTPTYLMSEAEQVLGIEAV